MLLDIATNRLQNQQLATPPFETPREVVEWFGAIQAQDFAAAKWALALRSKNQTDATIENAFNEGKILRTHIMRPTWHFVSPRDIRWLLALTSPHVHRFNGYYYRQSGLDKAIFERSNNVIRKALEDNKQLTRDELNMQLKAEKIPTENLGLSYTLMQAELDGIIVSGPRHGKQFTYMLLDERVPHQPEMTREEALAELMRRYFQSHGPAQLQDFCWWSGLSMTEVKKSIETVSMQKSEQNGKVYYYSKTETKKPRIDDCFLVPGFDEYFIAYKDRSDILDPQYAKQLNQGGGMVSGAVVVNGKMVGGWRRTFVKKSAVVTITLFEKITIEQQDALTKQTEKFGKFLEMPVTIKSEGQK